MTCHKLNRWLDQRLATVDGNSLLAFFILYVHFLTAVPHSTLHAQHAVTGYRTAASSLLRMHEAPAAAVDKRLGDDRTVFLPSRHIFAGHLHAAHMPGCHSIL